MDDKSLSELVKLFSNSSLEERRTRVEACSSSAESKSSVYENVQIFSDHLKTAKRFQKTFYYGDLLQSNFHPPLALTDATLELFNKTVPNAGRLDILNMDYATSISKAVCVSPYSMVLAMMYLEQLRRKNPDYLENVSPCDLFVVSILVASKYLFDNDEELIYNCDWANAANLEVQDLNRQEKRFLDAMNWQLFTEASGFFEYLSKVEERVALKQSSQRGWLSYTELYILSQSELFVQLWWKLSGTFIKVIFVVTVSYAAAVTVLYGALSITLSAQIPTKNFIVGLAHSEHPGSSSSNFRQFSPQKLYNSGVLGQNETYHTTHCQISDVCSLCKKLDERLTKLMWTKVDPQRLMWSRKSCYMCQDKQNFPYCLNYFMQSSMKNSVNKLKQSLLLLLLYTNNKKRNSLTLPINCSVVIKPSCNYSVSQA